MWVLRIVTEPAQPRNAPEFTLRDSTGANVHLSDYKGKVVLLNFWATWCGPCNIEIPWFIDLERKYQGRGFAVLGVSMDDEGWKVVKPFIEMKKINYPVLLGSDEISRLYGDIESLPTTLLIDREDKIASLYTGVVSRDIYEREISQLLGN